MIPPIEGWRRVDLGEVQLLVPPEGAGAGGIRYLERNPAVAPLAMLIERHGSGGEVLACEQSFTAEGEVAIQVAQRAGDDGEQHLGLVLTDGYYALLGAVSRGAAEHARYRELIGELTRRDVHHLGVRPRRALCAAPDGWETLERGLRTDYLGAGFPADPAAVSVYPATPRAAHDAGPVQRLLRAHGVRGRGERVLGEHGLRGARWRFATRTRDGRPLRREITVLAAGEYVYALRADGECDAAVETILDTLLPFPSRSAREERPLFAHWTH